MAMQSSNLESSSFEGSYSEETTSEINLTRMAEGVIPPPPGVVPDFRRRSTNHKQLLAADVICLSVAALAVLLRVYSRVFVTRTMSWDDHLCLVAMALAVAFGVAVAATLPSGTGEHLWNLRTEDVAPDSMAKWPLVITMLYLVAMAVLKISALLLFYRLFSVKRGARLTIRIAIGVVTLFSLAIVFLYFFGCRPTTSLWSPYPGTRCSGQANVLLGTAALNMASNFLTLVIPLPLIWRLQTTKKQRLSAMAVLALGSLVCSTCGFRLWALVQWSRSDDMTFALYNYYLASVVELNFGIVLACVPGIAGLIRHHRCESASAATSTSPNMVIKKLCAKGDVAHDSPPPSYKTTFSGHGSSGSSGGNDNGIGISVTEVEMDDEPKAWKV